MTIHAIIAGRGAYRDAIETGARAMSGRATSYAAAVRAVDAVLDRRAR